MNRFALSLFAASAVIAAIAPVRAQTPEPGQPAPPPPTTPEQPAPPPADTPAPPEEEERPRRRSSFGPEVGFYFPTDARTRDAFGSTWVNYGLGFRPIGLASRKGVLGFDLNIVSTAGRGRRALLIPVNLIYKRALTNNTPGEGITPYAGIATGLLIADLRSDNFGVSSGFRGGYGGTFLLGFTVNTQFFVEGRYQLYSKIKGFDVSGIGLSTGFRF